MNDRCQPKCRFDFFDLPDAIRTETQRLDMQGLVRDPNIVANMKGKTRQPFRRVHAGSVIGSRTPVTHRFSH